MPTRISSSSLLVAVALTAALGACAPRFDGRVYRGDGFAFRVGAEPPTWRQLHVGGAALAFRDDAEDATIAVNARCGADADDVPLAALTQQLFLQFTERQVVDQHVVPFDGREAMHTVLSAKLDGVPKKFDVWVLKKDGCIYDLDAITRPDRYEATAAPFARFVQAFSTLPSHAE